MGYQLYLKKGAKIFSANIFRRDDCALDIKVVDIFLGENNLWLHVHLIDSRKLLKAKVRLTLLDLHLMLILLSL
jgi:hypothetical protein